MSFLRATWRYLKRFVLAIRALLQGVTSFFGELLKTIIEGPLSALERLVRKILELLGRLLALIRDGWLRIWQQAPSTPRDKRKTPGRAALPLLASTATVAIWYLFPLADALELSRWRFREALAATWLVSLLLFRLGLRREPVKGITSWLIETHHRTGLIWFERAAVLALMAGCWATWGKAQAASAPLLLVFGFLALMTSEYRDRSLTDALPEQITPLGPDQPEASEGSEPEEEEDVELRSFRWLVPRATRTDTLDITVVVDRERYETMTSTNPKRPGGGVYPDWTPWVVTGSTEEVIRAAHEIRKLTNARGFSRFEEACAVLGFAQSIDYQADLETTGEEEYWRFPIETIYEGVGDCEDSSILAAAVLRALGYEVLPLVTKDHAAIGVSAPEGLPGTFVEWEGRRYYYCETTSSGFRIGELPSRVEPEHLRVCPLRVEATEGTGA